MSTIHVNDIDLHYEIIGAGEPLLLIHGHGSSAQDWVFQVEHFKRSHTVITYDVRGFGRSSKPKDGYSLPVFAQDAAALLGALNLGQVHVVGISMGGMIAFQLALDFPQYVKSMVVVNGYPETRVETWKEHFMVWRRFLVLGLLGMHKTGKMLSRILFIKPEQQGLREQFVEHWSKNDPHAYRMTMKAILNWDVESRLGEIKCPVLVVASDEDYLPLEEKQAYTKKMQNATLVVIEDARHAVTVEKPDEFNQIVEGFLRGIR
ncbi:MAG: 3-oxoadipate enol-lactonase [Anaerolineales bacterium]|nr:alpha/beta hydrolase [Anaerolineae bacterium]PWB69084.1 MAG: 3-oxoadipate enol-lactonase [Anaerolineales bacterium]